MKEFFIGILLILGCIAIGMCCSYQEQYYPAHRTVEGHDYVAVRDTWQHNPDCPKCKN